MTGLDTAVWEQWPLGAAIVAVVVSFLGFLTKLINRAESTMNRQAKTHHDHISGIATKFADSLAGSEARYIALQERTLNTIDENTKAIGRMEAAFNGGGKSDR